MNRWKRVFRAGLLLPLLVVTGFARADHFTSGDLHSAATLWEHDHYRGVAFRVLGPTQGLKAYDFNDVASSLCVNAGWVAVFYQHTNFEGDRLTVYGPTCIDDLKRDRPGGMDFGDRISSIEVFPQ